MEGFSDEAGHILTESGYDGDGISSGNAAVATD